jgi:hypothetical protein
MNLDIRTTKAIIIGVVVAVVSPIIVDIIRKRMNKPKTNIETNTDHGFSSWTGDEDFLGIKGDKYIDGNPSIHVVPFQEVGQHRERLKIKKYRPFNVSPAKKLRIK